MSKDEEFSFFNYLDERNYKKHDKNKYSKGYIIITLIGRQGNYISMIDTNPDHKLSKLGLCKTPTNIIESDILFKLFELEKKEIGTKAWKQIKQKQNV